jgi:hypothetical protein
VVHYKKGVNHHKSGSSGVVKMNIYKLRKIMDWIRGQGKLPTDEFGQILSVDDLMGWFGLSECLTRSERLCIKKELAAMVEAELSVERLRQLEQLRLSMS